MKPLAIIGLDPGTTSGYVIMDLEGQIIKSYSAKELSLSTIISQVIERCQPVITATDKAKLPSFVEEFSRKLGTVVVTPKEDLTKEEKKELISGLDASPVDTRFNSHFNSHQQDSLAAALFAYKKYSLKLEKINNYVLLHGLEDKKEQFMQLALKEELNFNVIKDILTKKNEETKVIKQVIKNDRITKTDFLKLYEKLSVIKKEKLVLESKITKLMKNAEQARIASTVLDKKSFQFDERVNGLLKVKEERIKLQEQEIDRLKQNLAAQNDKVLSLYSFIEKSPYLQLLKKLDNLGKKEFSAKNKILKITGNEYLLIGSPEIYSESVLDKLKDKNIVLVASKRFPQPIRQKFSTVLLSRGIFIDNDYFALVDRRAIDNNLSQKIFIEKIIESYKEERER